MQRAAKVVASRRGLHGTRTTHSSSSCLWCGIDVISSSYSLPLPAMTLATALPTIRVLGLVSKYPSGIAPTSVLRSNACATCHRCRSAFVGARKCLPNPQNLVALRQRIVDNCRQKPQRYHKTESRIIQKDHLTSDFRIVSSTLRYLCKITFLVLSLFLSTL